MSINYEEPKDVNNSDDIAAAERSQLMRTGWFCDPIFGSGDYPVVMKTQLAKVVKALELERSPLPEFTEDEKIYNRGKLLFAICQSDEMIKELDIYLSQGCNVFVAFLFVCLSTCDQDNSKSYVRIFLKFRGYVRHDINYRWFNLGRNLAGILDSGSLWNFRYHCVKGGIREPLQKPKMVTPPGE